MGTDQFVDVQGRHGEAMIEFDVVVPAYNEEEHIDECLRHITGQDYPSHLVNIFVVDAGSTDDTCGTVRRWTEANPRIRLLTGLGRMNAGQALNAGIAAGQAEFIARVDAHTYVDPDYLRNAAERFQRVDDDVALIGGQPTQVGETKFGEAVALARRSRFGVGDSVYSDKRELAYVETVQGGVYRRKTLSEVGGFATTMLVSEDEELAYRLTRSGYRVLLDTSLGFRYTTRSSWSALFRQHVNYGRSRVRVLTRHPGSFHLRYAVPLGFVLALGGLALGSLRGRLARKALAALSLTYLSGALVSAVRTAGDARHHIIRVVGCFSAQHLGYGFGLMRGLGTAISTRLGLAEPSAAVRRR